MKVGGAAALLREAREISKEPKGSPRDVSPSSRPHRLLPVTNRPEWNPSVGNIAPYFGNFRHYRVAEPYRPPQDSVHRDLDPTLPPFITLLHPIDRHKPLSEAIVPHPPLTSRVSPKRTDESPPKKVRSKSAPKERSVFEPNGVVPEKKSDTDTSRRDDGGERRERKSNEKKDKKDKKHATKTSLESVPGKLTMPDEGDVAYLFDRIDDNGSNMLSLAELDKAVKYQWPALDNKPAIMRAYKAADKDGTGFVTRDEFPYFMQYLVYHNNLFAAFKAADESGDRRLTREEFRDIAPVLNVDDADAAFDEMDDNKGGFVLFDEFCAWIARHRPGLDIDLKKKTKHGKHAEDSHQPHINKTVVDKKAQAEAKVAEQGAIKIAVPPQAECMALFDRLDPNGNGMLSLAELDKGVVELWPKLNNKPAIMRAYKAADKDGSGCVTRKEFGYFLRFLQYYNNLWADFMAADESGDRRITRSELKDAAKGLEIADPDAAFDEMDENKGGYVLFDEFCAWMAKNKSDWGVEAHTKKAAPTAHAEHETVEAVEQEESNSSAIVLHDGREVFVDVGKADVKIVAADSGTVFAMYELHGNIGFHFGDRYLTAPVKVGGPVTFEEEHAEGTPESLRQQWAVEYLDDAVLFMPVCRENETLDVVNGVVVTAARNDKKASQKCNLRLSEMLESAPQ